MVDYILIIAICLYFILIVPALWITGMHRIIANLVGGFNPFEKYARQNGFIFPK